MKKKSELKNVFEFIDYYLGFFFFDFEKTPPPSIDQKVWHRVILTGFAFKRIYTGHEDFSCAYTERVGFYKTQRYNPSFREN